MSPRIGITTSYGDGTQCLDRRYVTAVEESGGLPLPLPMVDTDATVNEIVDLLEGLVIVGGPAVTQGLVGSLPNELDSLDPVRANSDRVWIERCWDRGLPILGICYGMQRLNALAGGTIYGDVEAQHEGSLPHSQKREGTTHRIQISPKSRLRQLLDVDHLTVNTRHLQAVASVGNGFSVAATAPDGVIEAIEHESGKIFGVQFHPERMGADGAPLFRWLVTTAAASPATQQSAFDL